MWGVRLTIVLWGIVVWLGPSRAIAGDPLEDLLWATCRITDGEHSGTCFFVSVPLVKPESKRQVVLITAAHVLAQFTRPACELILRTQTEPGQFVRKGIPLIVRGEQPLWAQLPEVDIAALKIDLPADAAIKPIAYEQIVDERSLKERIVHVGQDAWIGCYPAQLESNDAGWPVLRKGSIASFPLFPVAAHKTLLVDYNVFGGDSGAPIAVVVNQQLLIAGVGSGMHRQTDRSTMPFEERVMHTPLGLSIASQSPLLRETIHRLLD